MDIKTARKMLAAASPWPWMIQRWVNKQEGGEFVGEIRAASGEAVYRGPFSFKALRHDADAPLIAQAPVAFAVLILAVEALKAQREFDTHHAGCATCGGELCDVGDALAETAIHGRGKALAAWGAL